MSRLALLDLQIGTLELERYSAQQDGSQAVAVLANNPGDADALAAMRKAQLRISELQGDIDSLKYVREQAIKADASDEAVALRARIREQSDRVLLAQADLEKAATAVQADTACLVGTLQKFATKHEALRAAGTQLVALPGYRAEEAIDRARAYLQTPGIVAYALARLVYGIVKAPGVDLSAHIQINEFDSFSTSSMTLREACEFLGDIVTYAIANLESEHA